MRHPFVLAFGLVLLAAAAAGVVGPLYEESAESCGSLLRPEPFAFCAGYEQRRRSVLLLLLAAALPALLAGLRRGSPLGADRRGRPLLAAAAGLLTLPVALLILLPIAVLDVLLHGFTQAQTGLPYVFAPAALAAGALVSARLAVRAGADPGAALAAAAVGLPLVLAVQAVAEALRWRLDDVATPLLLSGFFSYDQPNDAATLVTLALAAAPMPLLLGAAARYRRALPGGAGAVLLFLSATVGSLLFEATDNSLYAAASVRWLPLVLLPAGLAVLVLGTRSAPAAAGR